ncbi:MAG: hypothetical protein FJZ16_03860 [Candidatus Omnitrophica bacterium]|nr:hypothetical protein [Candidatus Omnitrophota bacterium]
MNEDEKFRELLLRGSEKELVEYYRTHLSHTSSGVIPNDTKREVIKGILDYKNATRKNRGTATIFLNNISRRL